MNKKGQALVEFVIILPVLVLLFFGAVDFGRIIIRKNELENLTGDVINLYKDGKSREDIDKLLKENDTSNNFELAIKDDNMIEFKLTSEIKIITPGLNKILGDNYEVSTKRVIYNE